MYLRLTYHYAGIREVLEHHSSRYGNHDARGVRVKPTRADVKRANDKRSARQLYRILAENFNYGDVHLVLTYRGVPEAPKKEIDRFLRRARSRMKKQEKEFKYVLVTEAGKTKPHYHIVTNLTDIKILRELWTMGGVHLTPLYPNKDYEQLASYLEKREKGKNEKGYSHSRNLVIPKAEVKVISSRTWAKRPYPPKGWFIRKASVEEFVNGDGYPSRRYIMEPVRPVKDPEEYWMPRQRE